MRLSDVMSHAGLAGYAIVALILFLAAFVAVVAWIARRSSSNEFARASRLPLEDDAPTSPERKGTR